MIYILALLISTCLIAGQSLWGSAVKSSTRPDIANLELLTRLLVHPRFWLGALFYLAGTICYFLLLSKVKFFSVQMTMTGLAIIFSVAVSYFFLREEISVLNLFGVCLILLGIFLVFYKVG